MAQSVQQKMETCPGIAIAHHMDHPVVTSIPVARVLKADDLDQSVMMYI
jgi:hypothetical protein